MSATPLPSPAPAPVGAPDPILSVRDVSLSFAGVQALRDLSFDVLPGELFSVIGPNGAGKTSTFNCLSGVYRPQSGSIRFAGRELLSLHPHQIAALGVARTFQGVDLIPSMSVVDNLMLGRHHLMRSGVVRNAVWLGRARAEEAAHRDAVDRIVELLGVGPVRHHPAGSLPFGVQKRVELGRALAMEPALLLLDEPVAGMNADEAREIAQVILRARSELRIAQILVEHDMGFVMGLADRVMVLDFGRRIALGTPAEVQRDPLVIAAYLGQAGSWHDAPAAAAET